MSSLSLVLITRNAAALLPGCIASTQGLVAEVVVVDSGSDDDTPAIARGLGARVEHADFRGFGPQKQLAVSLASHDWVLCLDADERLTPELLQSLREAMTAPQAPAYRFARRNRFFGRYLRHGEAYPDWCVRLFDRRHANWSDDAVHEKVIVNGQTATLAGDLLHDSAEDIGAYLNKQNRYTDMQAAALFATGKRASAAKLIGSPLARFLKFYVFKRGFLDGAAGFAHIAIGSFFAFIKYAKLMEHWRREGQE